MSEEIVRDHKKEVENKAVATVEKAQDMMIASNEDYKVAGDFLLDLKDLQKQINEFMDPIIKKAHEAHKEAIKQKKTVESPLKEAEKIVKTKMQAWYELEEKKRQEEERRLQEQAQKEAEEKRLAEAEALEKAGNDEAALNKLDEDVAAPTVIVPKQTPKIEGVSNRQVWNYRIKDESKIPREYMIPDRVRIGQIVRANKDRTDIPGVEVYSETNLAAGRR